MSDLLDFRSWAHTTWLIIETVAWLSAFFALSRTKLSSGKAQTVFPAIVLGVLIAIRFGFMPVGWGISGDREIYALRFQNIQRYGYTINFDDKDPGWNLFMSFISLTGDYNTFFIVQSALYVSLYLVACRRLAGANVFWLFVAVVASMGFSAYGVNTMRAGLAIALVICGITFKDKALVMYPFFAAACLIHFSTTLPIAMLVLCRYVNASRVYICFWFICILLSAAFGNTFNYLFANFIDDDRSGYLTIQSSIYNQGFRLDFVIYSFLPIIVGRYFVEKCQLRNHLYQMVYNAYILTNGFWILVIRASFTDRFAYLSWFMIPFVLVYPLIIRDCPVRHPERWLACILAGEAMFLLII